METLILILFGITAFVILIAFIVVVTSMARMELVKKDEDIKE